MGKKTRKIHKQHEQHELEINNILKQHNVNIKQNKKTEKKNEKNVFNNLKLFNNFDFSFVRKPEDWPCHSHNIEKRQRDLLKWCYCKYKTPSILLEQLLIDNKNSATIFDDLFFYIGRGESLHQHLNAYFSKRESHLFLITKFPSSYEIKEAMIYTKAKNAGLSNKFSNILVERFSLLMNFSFLKRKEMFENYLNFISKNNEINIQTLLDISDFIKVQIYAGNEFCFKKRTLNSLINIVNEWHKSLNTQKIKDNIEYVDLHSILDWTFIDENQNTWSISQITSYNNLLTEGRKLHHCVSSYHILIKDRKCYILSLKLNNERILTIQLSPNFIVQQVRGTCNRLPNNTEQSIIRKWTRQIKIKEGICFI